MDSLTQLTLGAAVGEAVLGRQVGRRAALWGGLLGTLPDLDVFWRVLVVGPTGYAEGYYSLLDRTRPLELTQYPSHPELLAGLEDAWAVRRLRWFTQGFYAVGREGDAVVITDLRMGLEPDYVFRFQVGEVHNPHVVPVKSRHLPAERRLDRLGELWDRLRGAPLATGSP